jgi:methionyl-tRNA synthetase
MYVWLDALTNYLTAVGYPDTQCDAYKTFWPASVHVVGKDIIRFHCVYWPAFLMAAGIAPPQRVFAHGWWTVEGQKMSKSSANFIPPAKLVEEYGVDALRYFMLRELPFGSDGDFSRRAVIGRINGDLANGFGNLAQRVLSMVGRYCERRVPEAGLLNGADRALLESASGLLAKIRADMTEPAFHRALETIWQVIGDADRYVDEQAPWALKKSDPVRLGAVLWTLVETLRHIAIMTQPFIPGAATKLLDQLAVPENARDFAALSAHPIKAGTLFPKPAGIFPRFIEAEAAT